MTLKIIDIKENPNCLNITNPSGVHKYVKCPLINNQIIQVDDCFDCAMVAEGIAPKCIASEQLTRVKNFEEICMKCPNHLD